MFSLEPHRKNRSMLVAGIILMILSSIMVAGAASNNIVFDADSSPVAKFPGNISLNGNMIANVGRLTIAGGDVDMAWNSVEDRFELSSNGNEDICIGNCTGAIP